MLFESRLKKLSLASRLNLSFFGITSLIVVLSLTFIIFYGVFLSFTSQVEENVERIQVNFTQTLEALNQAEETMKANEGLTEQFEFIGNINANLIKLLLSDDTITRRIT